MDLAIFETTYIIAVIRTLVDTADPNDVAMVDTQQDEIKVKAVSSKPFMKPNYDNDPFEQALKVTIEFDRDAAYSRRAFGKTEDVNLVWHFLGTAFGWSGLSKKQAYCLNVEQSFPIGQYKIDVLANVPVEAFW